MQTGEDRSQEGGRRGDRSQEGGRREDRSQERGSTGDRSHERSCEGVGWAGNRQLGEWPLPRLVTSEGCGIIVMVIWGPG